jgi:tetratricopeptide (TPR) repeat protein
MTRWLWVGLLLSLMIAPARADKPEAVALRRQGDALLREGRAGEAEAVYRKAIAIDPGYREAYGALSTHLLRAGAFDKAVTLLQGVVKTMPDYAEGWYNLAYALRKRGRLDDAVSAYQRYAKLRPQSADPHFGIGLALQAKGELKAAAASFRRYAQLENDPTKRSWVDRALKLAVELEGKAFRTAKTPSATPAEAKATVKKPAAPTPARPSPTEDAVIDPYAEGSAAAPKPSKAAPPERDTPERRRARPLKDEGDRLTRAGRLEQAVDRYRQAIAIDFSYVAALNELGNVLFTLKRYSDAIQVFRVAIRDNPTYSLGWYNLAYALRKAGRIPEAIAAYRKFIQLEPKDADPHYGLGLAYLALGQKTEAANAFKEYIRLERRAAQERWVHKAQVELAKLEGRTPPAYVPGSILAPTPPEPERPKTKAELRAEATRKAAEQKQAKLAAAKAAAEAKRRQAAEARKAAAEAKKQKAEEAKAARLAAAEAKKQKAEEAKAARLAAAEAKKAGRAPAPAAGAAEMASVPPIPKGVTPAADTIESPPMPPPPGQVPASESGKLRVQADTLARAGKCVNAAPLYKRATELDPFDVAAYDGVAHCAFKLGAYRPGAALVGIGLRDNPEYARGWLYLARLERAGGQGERAVGAYRKLLGKQPQNPDAHFELARTLKALGRGAEAVVAYRDFLRLERRPGSASARAAAVLELRALGGDLPALGALGAAPSEPARKAPLPAPGVAEHSVEKSPAELRAEARRKAAADKKAQAEAEKAARAEKQRLRDEARKQAGAEKRAKLEAAKAAAEEKRRAAREAAEEKRQAAKRKREEARLAALAKRKGVGKGKGKGARGSDEATAVAEAVGKDVAETAPPPEPASTHDLLKAAPDAAKGLLAVADAQFAKQRYDIALGIYQQASKLDPSATEPLYKAGVAAVALRQMHLAADLFARVVQLDPGNATALTNLKMAQNAARGARPSAQYLQNASAEVETALEAGRYAAALRQLDKLLAIESSAKRHLLRSLAYLGLRQPQRAVQDAGRALALDPAMLDGYRAMGDAHRQLGKKEKAVYYYRLYLARAPADGARRSEVERAITELQ